MNSMYLEFNVPCTNIWIYCYLVWLHLIKLSSAALFTALQPQHATEYHTNASSRACSQCHHLRSMEHFSVMRAVVWGHLIQFLQLILNQSATMIIIRREFEFSSWLDLFLIRLQWASLTTSHCKKLQTSTNRFCGVCFIVPSPFFSIRKTTSRT